MSSRNKSHVIGRAKFNASFFHSLLIEKITVLERQSNVICTMENTLVVYKAPFFSKVFFMVGKIVLECKLNTSLFSHTALSYYVRMSVQHQVYNSIPDVGREFYTI